jgi:hypothetical protein
MSKKKKMMCEVGDGKTHLKGGDQADRIGALDGRI